MNTIPNNKILVRLLMIFICVICGLTSCSNFNVNDDTLPKKGDSAEAIVKKFGEPASFMESGPTYPGIRYSSSLLDYPLEGFSIVCDQFGVVEWVIRKIPLDLNTIQPGSSLK